MYDVTSYARDHPGGLEPLLEIAGQDATSAYEDVGHSEDAREIMHDLLVGVLEGANVDASNDSESSSTEVSHITLHRYDTSNATSTPQQSLTTARLEFAIGLIATSGITYLVNKYHLVQLVDKFANDHSVHMNYHGFTQGFLTASVAMGIASALGVRYLANASQSAKSFDSYAPHIHSTAVKGDFHPAGTLRSTEYQKFKLRKREPLSEGIYRFTFDLPTRYSVLGLPIGQHVAIKAEVDEHSVVRSYTPVSNNRDLGRLELIIRVYPDGRLGNYLKNLEIGHSAEIRGPKGAMKYRRGMSKHLGMVGGGTGITPLYQLIRAICEDKNDHTTISLIYGNRSESDIMLRDELDKFASENAQKFKLHYTLDKPSSDWKGGKGHVTKDLLKDKMPEATADTKILLCGPPGMVNAVKDSLIELGFEAPGAVSKMSDQIFCF